MALVVDLTATPKIEGHAGGGHLVTKVELQGMMLTVMVGLLIILVVGPLVVQTNLCHLPNVVAETMKAGPEAGQVDRIVVAISGQPMKVICNQITLTDAEIANLLVQWKLLPHPLL